MQLGGGDVRIDHEVFRRGAILSDDRLRGTREDQIATPGDGVGPRGGVQVSRQGQGAATQIDGRVDQKCAIDGFAMTGQVDLPSLVLG